MNTPNTPYISKYANILYKLKATDFALFGHFPEQAYRSVSDCVMKLIDCNHAKTNDSIREFHNLYEPHPDLDTSKLDSAVKEASEAIRRLNDLSKRLGLPVWADINTDDPEAVIRVAHAYTNELAAAH